MIKRSVDLNFSSLDESKPNSISINPPAQYITKQDCPKRFNSTRHFSSACSHHHIFFIQCPTPSSQFQCPSVLLQPLNPSLDVTDRGREVFDLLERDCGGHGAIVRVVLVQHTEYPVVHQLNVSDTVNQLLDTLQL